MGNKRGIASTLKSVGALHSAQGNYAQALEHFQRSLEIVEEVGDKQGIAETPGYI